MIFFMSRLLNRIHMRPSNTAQNLDAEICLVIPTEMYTNFLAGIYRAWDFLD